jgi:glycerol-1-phosphate dehydrogenase [NAD(P)+]
MTLIDPIYIGDEAVTELASYCQQHDLKRLVLVADDNTYAALGQKVEAALHSIGSDLTVIILKGPEVQADAHYLMQVLAESPVQAQTFVAVGSGTITDIVRFVSHRTRNPFISIPSAPSVDGFTSVGAPLVLGGVKQTLKCQPPQAVFADLPTIQAAPPLMIAAGFGDMLGKITSLADWKLGTLLWDEAYDEAVARRSQKALDGCMQNAVEISRGTSDGICYLMDALVESGLSILEFGASHPASGTEHHASHYWEMMLLQQNRPALLHGAKVGVATVFAADLYARLLTWSQDEVRERIDQARMPDSAAECEIIRAAYGPAAESVIQSHQEFLNMSEQAYAQLKERVWRHWEDVRAIAQAVPSGETIAGLLKMVGGPTTGAELGLAPDEIQRGYDYGHYLRARFTVRKLYHLLGLSI